LNGDKASHSIGPQKLLWVCHCVSLFVTAPKLSLRAVCARGSGPAVRRRLPKMQAIYNTRIARRVALQPREDWPRDEHCRAGSHCKTPLGFNLSHLMSKQGQVMHEPLALN
jgi:hypothetical protein